MAITAETRNDIIELVVTAYNAAPGTTLLNELVAIVNGGGTLADVATNLTTRTEWTSKYPAFQTAEEFAAEWLSNLVPEASADALTEGTAAVIGQINGGASFADLLVQAQTFLSTASETDAGFGTSAANFNNKVEVATHHTVTLEQADQSTTAISAVTSDDATVESGKDSLGGGAGTGGATFTLTTGTDAIVGTAGDDAINSAAGTLASGDTINGGEGTDTLNITATGTAPAQTASTLSNVEIVNITASPNPLSIDMKGVTGVTQINNSNSANSATVTVSNVGAPVNSTLTGGQAATTIGYTTAVTASTATSDASTLTLAGTNLGASYTATGIEDVTVSSTKSANTLSSLGVSSATKVTVTGDQALTINGTTGGSKLATVDAAGFTGTSLTLTAGAGAGGTSKAGVAVTLPTADTVTSTVTTGGNKDTITLGAGNATVVAGGGDDTITSGAGTNTIMGGTGNDTITLSGTKDTLRYAEAGTSNSDSINGFDTSGTTVISVNLGTAQTATAAAAADSDFGVVQTGATSPTFGNVDGKGTGTAIVFQAVSPTATTTVNPVAGGSNVLALNGAFTDGTAAGVVTALGTSATTAIETVAASKFLIVTYSVGNIAQVWSYDGDNGTGNVNGNIDANELNLVATLNNVTQNALTAANFSTYLTAATTSGTVSNEGQTITLNTPLNLVQTEANANGHFLTAASDTITVATGMLPTGKATATMGLTVIDPAGTGDADVLSATVLNQGWDLGTLISNVETVNLEYLTAGNGFAMSSILPGTDVLGVSGLSNTGAITNVISGTAFAPGSTYTGVISVTRTAATDDLTLNLNGTHTTAATAAATQNFIESGATTPIDDLTINVGGTSVISLDLDQGEDFTDVTIKGGGNLTIYTDNDGLAKADIATTTLGYTGTFTVALTDAAGTLDLTDTGSDVVGLDVLDITAGTTPAPDVTLPAVTGGGSFTVKHAPATSAAAGSAGNIKVTQLGGATNDSVTVSLGTNSNGAGTITADNTENLTVASSATSTTTDTVGNIQIAAGAGTQTVTLTSSGKLTTGTINADTIVATGVSKALTVGDLINTVGTTTFTGGDGGVTLDASAAAGGVALNVTTGKGDDTITTEAGDDTVNVGNGTNSATTGAGTDSITGGTGVDTIRGGTGDDSATGGAGADIFQYHADGESTLDGSATDKILDYEKGTDKLSFDTSADGTTTDDAAVAADAANVFANGFATGTLATNIAGAANLGAAITLHIAAIADNAVAGFNYNGNSYIVHANGANTAGNVVELVGVTGASIAESTTIDQFIVS